MSERTPLEPEKARLRPDDDEPDVEGHLFQSPDERARLNPDVDELDEGDEPGRIR
jgi:hypothetical protein